MICQKCGKEFSDDMKNCPFCLEPVKTEKKKFVVNIADGQEDEENESIFFSDRAQAYRQSFIGHEKNTYAQGDVPFSEEHKDVISFDTPRKEPVGNRTEETTAPVTKKDDTYIRFTFEESAGDRTAETAETVNEPKKTEAFRISEEATDTGSFALSGEADSVQTVTQAGEPDDTAEPDKVPEEAGQPDAAKPKPPKKAKKQPDANAAKSARAFMTLRIMIAVCVLLTVGLTVVGASTSIFKNSAGADKTVALSGLSKEAAASFESTAPALSAFFESGYDSSQMTFDALVPYLSPNSESGILAAMFSRQPLTENQPDPLGRFSDGESASYVSIDSRYVHQAAALYGLSVVDDIDTADCYCYGDRYYFSASQSGEEAGRRQVKVTSSKQTQEGKYYIVCAVYPETATKDEKGNFSGEPESEVYFIAGCEKTDSGFSWTVYKISPTPLFDAAGSAISNTDESGLPYEMKRKTVKAVTSDGQAYANYIIEYPYFTTQGVTQSTVNTLYRQLISSYEKKAQYADKYYARYLKSGAGADALPLTVHIVSTVTFNDKGYLSLLERTTENDPTVTGQTASQQETTSVPFDTTQSESAAQTETPVMPKTTVAGYTFDVESGDFVQKDDVLGKDYQTLQKLLFEAWTEQNKVTDSTAEEASPYGGGQPQGEITDTDGIGQAIYACAWVLLPDGVGFCYQPENGGAETVVLSYDQLEPDIFSGR